MTAGISLRNARAPDGMRLYAIGDIHGRLDLLARMHDQIRAEIDRDRPADWRIVHLGDYVDRGPDSRSVLDFLLAAHADDARNILLAGNHDLGMLAFLAEPTMESLFIQYGGIETAASYGVRLDGPHRSLPEFHAELAASIPAAHTRLLGDCVYSASFRDFFFCHAGVRPGVPLERQDPDDLVWIRNAFLRHGGLHPKLVVHGHTIVRQPELLDNRVNIDTGAWHSGVLTALVAEGAEKRLLSVGV